MDKDLRKQILEIAEEEDVEFVRLQFTDMFGRLKNLAIPVNRLEKAMDNRCTIDISSIEGVRDGEETDMYLYPDLSTFTILPWRPQQGKVARFICDIRHTDGTLYESNPRSILKRAVEAAEKKGYMLRVNPECEFFLFHTDDNGMATTLTHEQAGYMDTSPVDLGENARRDIVLTLEEMGYEIESSHHEIAPAQHEVDFQFDGALDTADKLMTFKMAVRTIAKRHGLHATFMPKPKAGVNGSGMHVNMQLIKDGKNIFYDERDVCGLSKEAYAFMAGILAHIEGMTIICNPLVNSYKRLTPGFEAPSDITWSTRQRTSLIRVPYGRQEETCLELRSPDASANPYLVFALCLSAGMDGIEKQMQVPEELKKDIRKMTEDEKEQLGIGALPGNLSEALDAFGKDTFVQEVLGHNFTKQYRKAKKAEWRSYMEQVSEWELNQYLYQN